MINSKKTIKKLIALASSKAKSLEKDLVDWVNNTKTLAELNKFKKDIDGRLKLETKKHSQMTKILEKRSAKLKGLNVKKKPAAVEPQQTV
jgi:hypothetical protein